MAQAKRPAHEIRRGPIKATIWENKGKDGVFFKFTVARLYKEGDDWKSTSSFGSQDIPKLAGVLVQVEDWIRENTPKRKAA
jgi:hypothetical protein